MRDISMSWVFDDPERFVTMSRCQHTWYSADMNNNNGRWNVSNIHWYWRNASWWYGRTDAQWTAHGIADRPSRYVYPIGTFSSPEWWAGADPTAAMPSMFDLIPEEVLEDIRLRRALLLIDNLNEGFHTPWLWKFFHAECDRLAIPPRAIIWLNSNETEASAYERWADSAGMTDRIEVISFCHLMYQQRIAFNHTKAPSWEQHLERKALPDVKLYNCLNRVKRPHREYLVLRLIQDDLFRLGMVSHDQVSYEWDDSDITASTMTKAMRVLPAVVDDANFQNNKAMTINTQIYLDSWLSIITETHATDDPDQLFISEKIWKPVYSLHPFLVLGNKNTLQAMESMGYQVDFLGSKAWDGADYATRVERLIDAIRGLRSVSDKLAWFDGLRAQCEHNHSLFMRQDFFRSAACDAILRAYEALP